MMKNVLNLAACFVRAGWTQGASARDEKGKIVSATEVRATCFCLIGAISRAAYAYGADSIETIEAVRRSPSCPTVLVGDRQERRLMTWNDMPGRTQEEVATLVETVAKEQDR